MRSRPSSGSHPAEALVGARALSARDGGGRWQRRPGVIGLTATRDWSLRFFLGRGTCRLHRRVGVASAVKTIASAPATLGLGRCSCPND
jgi:hypothetical protein